LSSLKISPAYYPDHTLSTLEPGILYVASMFYALVTPVTRNTVV